MRGVGRVIEGEDGLAGKGRLEIEAAEKVKTHEFSNWDEGLIKGIEADWSPHLTTTCPITASLAPVCLPLPSLPIPATT